MRVCACACISIGDSIVEDVLDDVARELVGSVDSIAESVSTGALKLCRRKRLGGWRTSRAVLRVPHCIYVC